MKDNISVRGVDIDLYLEVKSIAARDRSKKMGDVVTQALSLWLEEYRAKEEG